MSCNWAQTSRHILDNYHRQQATAPQPRAYALNRVSLRQLDTLRVLDTFVSFFRENAPALEFQAILSALAETSRRRGLQTQPCAEIPLWTPETVVLSLP